MREQEFGGIYCSVLTLKYEYKVNQSQGIFFFSLLVDFCSSSVVSAGLVRVLGCEVAELPLVATSREFQGQVSLSLLIYIYIDMYIYNGLQS